MIGVKWVINTTIVPMIACYFRERKERKEKKTKQNKAKQSKANKRTNGRGKCKINEKEKKGRT